MEQTFFDVFISYRRKGGSEKAQLVKSELKQRGVEEERIFLDTHSLHDGDFEQKIKVAIEQSQSVVVIISGGCFDEVKETDYWYMEIREAMLQRKKIVPILFDGITSLAALDVPKEFLDLTKMNAVSYQHEYADAAFDKLLLFIGIQQESHYAAKKRGCLFSFKYKGCLLSVVLFGLVVFVLTPITFMQLGSSGSLEDDDMVCYAPESNALECPSANDRTCSDARVSESSSGYIEKDNPSVVASMPPEKKNEKLFGRWQGMGNKLVLSFRAKDVIMEKQDSGIVKTKQGEYRVKGNCIVLSWKDEESQTIRYEIVDDWLCLLFDDGQTIMLKRQ